MNPAATLPGADPRPALISERRIVAALRCGDEAAFGELIARNHENMRRVARTLVDCDALAEEVVQEAWVAVLRGIHRFEGRSSLSTWIYAIVANQAKSICWRERRTIPFSSVAGEGESAAVDPDRFQGDDEEWPGHWATPPRPWQKPERRLLSLEIRENLKRALSELPERQRTVVTLRDVEGLTAQEVCGLLDLSVENQRVLLHRGRSKLRGILESYLAA